MQKTRGTSVFCLVGFEETGPRQGPPPFGVGSLQRGKRISLPAPPTHIPSEIRKRLQLIGLSARTLRGTREKTRLPSGTTPRQHGFTPFPGEKENAMLFDGCFIRRLSRQMVGILMQ